MSTTNQEPLKVAVIEGWHPFDAMGFRDLFRALPGIDPCHQTVENWAIDVAGVRRKYDVLVFYNMNQKKEPECAFCQPALIKAIQELGEEPGQGILFLHHSILAYPDDTQWSQMVGIEQRTFGFHVDQTFPIEIAKPEHPIVRGLSNWEMFDETYTMGGPGAGSEVLLTTPYEKSMPSLGWTHTYRNARVFCFQLGHDARAWANPNFREVLSRGILWAGGRL